jgi:hypothetical protein
MRSTRTTPLLALVALMALSACAPSDGEPAGEASGEPGVAATAGAQDAFWANLGALCESAAEGVLLQAPDDQIDPEARLVVHFWECGEEEIRFPLHVDENRSRTWVFIRHGDRIELRHDHRNPDGSEESNTWYGASTLDVGTPNRQEFVTEREDGSLGGWRVEIQPGEHYTYGTIRDGEWRHHLEFDLNRPVELPPMHWGHEVRPSQRP